MTELIHFKKYAMMLLMAIMLIGVVSATDYGIDNYIKVSEDKKVVEIWDKGLFLIGEDTKLAEATLKTDLVENVGVGKDVKVFEIELNSKVDYENLLSEINYYNIKDKMNPIEINLDLKYKSIIEENYSYDVCSSKDNKTISCETINTKRNVTKWYDYSDRDMLEGQSITIGGFTTTEEGDKIEWIPTIAKEEINVWASWEAGMTAGTMIYYNFNNATNASKLVDNINGTYNGTFSPSPPTWVAGLANDSLSFDALGERIFVGEVNTSEVIGAISLWFNSTLTIHEESQRERFLTPNSAKINVNFGEVDGNLAHEYISTNDGSGTRWDSGLCSQTAELSNNTWHHLVMNWNGTDYEYWLNGVNNVSDYCVYGTPTQMDMANLTFSSTAVADIYYRGSLDLVGFWNRALTPTEIANLYNGGAGLEFPTATPAPEGTPNITLNIPANAANIANTSVTFNWSVWDDHNVTNSTFYLSNGSIEFFPYGLGNETTFQIQIDNFAEGSYSWNITATDNASQQGNSTQRTFKIDVTNPSVNITNPINQSYASDNSTYNITANFTASDNIAGLDTCWYYNGTANNTITCGNNVTINFTEGGHRIYYYANDSAGNFNSTYVDFFINYYDYDVEFEPTAVEEENTTFYLNITATDLSTIEANLTYNNTNYTMSGTSNGTFARLSKTLTMPDIAANVNVTFNFTYIINAGSSAQTDSYGQLIYIIPDLNVSSSPCSDLALNITLKDEENLGLMNGDFEYNFKYGLSNNTLKTAYGKIEGKKGLYVCVNSTISNNWTLGEGEIFYTASAGGYAQRRYYLFKGTPLTNITNNISIYALNSSKQTSFQLEVQDTSLNPYVDKYTTLVRWYPDLNEYNVVDMGNTDELGTTIIHVEVEDVDYRIGVYEKNGSLIHLASPIRMVCLISPCTYTLSISPEDEDFTSFLEIEYSLDYNYTTGIWTFEFTDTSQRTTEMNLTVYRITGTNTYPVCSSAVSAYTGAITCNTSAYTGTLKAVVERSASPPVPIAQKIIQTTVTAFRSTFGLWISFLIGVPVVFIFAIVSPVAAVIGGVIAMIPAYYFGAINWIILGGIAVLAGIIIHFLKRIG